MTWNRTTAIATVVVLVLLLLAYGFWPAATPVTVTTVARDSLRVTVEEEGRTRVADRYVVSAPTTGYLRRVAGEAGDRVVRGAVVARLAALPPSILDASRFRAAQAQVEAARAGLERARHQADAAQATAQHADTSLRRIRRLAAEGTASPQALDAAQAEARTATAQSRAAQQAVAQARQELRAARHRLGATLASPDTLATRVRVTAPATGQVLQVHAKSAGVVQAGAPLLTVGPTDSLEVVVDVLSSDAVRISEGTPVELIRWGGGRALEGTVRRVSPRGQTDVSALGVEEQRVEVVVDLEAPASVRERLGDGYRMVARFVLWAGDEVLQVPQSALVRHDGGWAVFVVEGGTAQRQAVTVGRRSGLQAQVTDGLSAGDRVITHPGNELTDGASVTARV